MRKSAPLSLSSKCLIAANCLTAVYEVFLGFMILVIVGSFENPIAGTAIYNFSLFGAIVVGFFAIVKVVKRGGEARMNAYRGGLLVGVASLALIAAQGIDGNEYLIGALFGFFTAFACFAKEAAISDTVDANQMTKFSSYNAAATMVSKLVVPALVGVAVYAYSYSVAAMFTMPFLLAAFAISFFISGGGGDGKPARLEVGKFISAALASRHMRRVFTAEFLMGMTIWGAMGTITAIYAATLFETAASFGMLSSFVMMFLIAVKFMIARFGGARHLAAILKALIAIFFIAAAVFLTLEGRGLFIVYNLAYVAMAQVAETQGFIYMLSALKVAGIAPRLTTEYQLVRQVVLNIGRYVGYGSLLAIGVYGSPGAMKWLLIVMVAIVAVIAFLYSRMNRDEGHKL